MNAPTNTKDPTPPQRNPLDQPYPHRLPKRKPLTPPPKEAPTTATGETSPTEQGPGIESRPQDGPKDVRNNPTHQHSKLAAPPYPTAPYPPTDSSRTHPTQKPPSRTDTPFPPPAPKLGEISHMTKHTCVWPGGCPPTKESTQSLPLLATREYPQQPKASGRMASPPPQMAKRCAGTRLAPSAPDMSTHPCPLMYGHLCPNTRPERESTRLAKHSVPSHSTVKLRAHKHSPHKLVPPSPLYTQYTYHYHKIMTQPPPYPPPLA